MLAQYLLHKLNKINMHNQSSDQLQQFSSQSFSEQQQPNSINTESKMSRLIKKKFNKFEKHMQNALSFINPQQIQEAIQMIKRVLIQIQDLYFNLCPFKGQGFKEDWEEYLLGGPMEWFMKNKETDNLSKNPFDLLSLCYAIQMNKNTNISTEQFFDFYDELLQRNGELFYQIQIGKGHLYYAKNQYYEAHEQYKKLRYWVQDQQKLLQCMAWVTITKFKDYSRYSYLQNCLQINPNNFAALFLKALTQQDNKIQSIEKLIEINPQYYRLYIQRGLLESQFKNKQMWFRKALEYNPNSIFANLTLIKEECKSIKTVSLMRKKLSETSFLARQQPDILFCLAQIQENINLKEAIKLYQKCLELNPYHFWAMQGLAEVYRMNKQIVQLSLQKAISLYNKYIECNPHNQDIYNYLGMALEEMGYKQQAVSSYQEALQVNPQFFEAYLNLGHFYQHEENFQLALIYYKDAALLCSEDTTLCYGIAMCYYYLKNYEQSQVWAKRCYKYGCRPDQVLQLLGNLSFLQKLYFQSLKWYLKHVVAAKQLNTLYIMQNLIKKISKQQAMQILKKAYQTVSRSQNWTFYFLQLGILIQNLGQYEQALKVYRTLLKIVNEINTPLQIRKQLSRVFRDNKETGTLSIRSKVQLKKLQEVYFRIFQQAYNSDETPIQEKRI